MLNFVAPCPIQRGACIFLHNPSLRSNHPYLYSSDIKKVRLKAFRLVCFVVMDRFICSGMMSPGLPSQNILNISETTSLLEEEQRPLLPLYHVSEFLRFNVMKWTPLETRDNCKPCHLVSQGKGPFLHLCF